MLVNLVSLVAKLIEAKLGTPESSFGSIYCVTSTLKLKTTEDQTKHRLKHRHLMPRYTGIAKAVCSSAAYTAG